MNGPLAKIRNGSQGCWLSPLRADQPRHAVANDRHTEFAACPAYTIFELLKRTRPRVVDTDNHVARLQASPVCGRLSLGTQDLRAQQVTVEAIAGQNIAQDSAG